MTKVHPSLFAKGQLRGFIGSLSPSYDTTKTFPIAGPPSFVVRLRTSTPVNDIPSVVPIVSCVATASRSGGASKSARSTSPAVSTSGSDCLDGICSSGREATLDGET